MFFILPYKAYNPYCGSSFYVSLITEPNTDGSCLNEVLSVGVLREAQESLLEWKAEDGLVNACHRVRMFNRFGYCEQLYNCQCEKFCTIIIELYRITHAPVEVCEINVY